MCYCGTRYALFLLQLIWPRRFYLAGDFFLTNPFHLFKIRWSDHLVSYFSLMYCYGNDTDILHLIFSRAES